MNLIRKSNYARPTTNFWNDFFHNDLLDFTPAKFSNETLPAVNIKDGADQVDIELAAPGLKKDDFKIEVDNDVLSISAEKTSEADKKDGEYTRKEFGYGNFTRTFTLPDWAKGEKIEASYEDGVLRVMIPKKDEAKLKPSRLVKVA